MANPYHLAQINITRLRTPIDDPLIADFVANLDRINALAEQSPGFVWRLQGDNNSATGLRVYDDPYIIVNMSVWESVEALYQYTYYSDHTAIFRRRAEWFTRMDTPYFAVWWIPAEKTPTIPEAQAALESLLRDGPTPFAFTFKRQFTLAEMLAARLLTGQT